MSLQVVQFDIKEFIIDPDAIAVALTRTCRRNGAHLQVTGVCQTQHRVLFALDSAPGGGPCRYELKPFTGMTNDEVAADIFSRWKGGFATRGLVQLEDQFLGLFEIPSPNGQLETE